MTARPRGAVSSLPRPIASAIGIMPLIMARLVIRIGRSRSPAASRAASKEGCPARRLRSAKVTSRMALARATPTTMIMPMKLCRFRLVPVTSSRIREPASPAGAADRATRLSRTDWKLAVSSSSMTTSAETRPIARLVKTWRRTVT